MLAPYMIDKIPGVTEIWSGNYGSVGGGGGVGAMSGMDTNKDSELAKDLQAPFSLP